MPDLAKGIGQALTCSQLSMLQLSMLGSASNNPLERERAVSACSNKAQIPGKPLRYLAIFLSAYFVVTWAMDSLGV